MALHPPLSTGPADPAGVAQEEHLLLMLIATYSRLLPDMLTFGFVSVYIWSQNVCRHPTLLPPSFSPSSWSDSDSEHSLSPQTCRKIVWRKLAAEEDGACLSPLISGLARRRQRWGVRSWSRARLGVCFLRLSQPTSDLAKRGRQMEARLDGEFAFYASSCRLRVPLFGTGQEVAAEGRSAGWGACFQLAEFPCT